MNKGLSIVQVIIVIALIGILSTIVIGSSSRQVSYYTLQKTNNGLISLLEKAHSRSINSYNDSKHSVRIESARAILFEGSTYVSSSPTNQEFTFDSGITASNVSLNGGGSTVTFEKVTGATTQHGTVRLQLVSSPTSSSTIVISEAGVIYNQ